MDAEQLCFLTTSTAMEAPKWAAAGGEAAGKGKSCQGKPVGHRSTAASMGGAGSILNNRIIFFSLPDLF